MRIATLAGIALIAGGASASAQETSRYTLEKTEDGYVRMDNRTGEMSICEERTGELFCRRATDERAAPEDDLGQVMDKLDDIEQRLSALEASRPVDVLPSEQDIDKTLNFMERFFRRFMEVVKDFDQDNHHDAQPSQPAPPALQPGPRT